MPGPVQRHDDVVEDEDLQEITLNEGIPYKIYPKTVTEDGHPFGIGKFPLQPDEDEDAQHQDAGGIINDRLHLYSSPHALCSSQSPHGSQFAVIHPLDTVAQRLLDIPDIPHQLL